MKMIDVLHMPRRLWLGRKTEQNFRPIAFDVYKWLTDYPEATVSIIYTRPDGQIFPVASSDRSPIIWIPQQDVTTVSGEGEIELHLVGGGAVGISASTKTLIDDSAASAQPTALSWVDQVVQDVTEQADRAEEAASHYPKIVNGVWYVWNVQDEDYVSTGIEAQGEDGYSPTVTVTEIEGGHRVTITDADGAHTFDVMDGEGGSGGAVDSVNGKTGAVVLDASDVGALPDDTPIPAAVTEQTVAGWGFTKNTGDYTKPSGGIPKTDLAAGVIPDISGKADAADLTAHTSDTTVHITAAERTAWHGKQDKIPTLSDAQKAALRTLMSQYRTNAKSFVYNYDATLNAYASASTVYENGKAKLNCALFAELVWMGVPASHFTVGSANYTTTISKVFDWGYQPEFKMRRLAYRLVRNPASNPAYYADGEIKQQAFISFVKPFGDSFVDSHSANSYYSVNAPTKYRINGVDYTNPCGQQFRSFMYGGDLAIELANMGCEIPVDEMDTGDIVFFDGGGDDVRLQTNYRNISHVAICYGRDVDTNEPILYECTSGLTSAINVSGSAPTSGTYPYTYDAARRARLMNHIVMVARHPVAFGIGSNVKSAFSIYPTPADNTDSSTAGRAYAEPVEWGIPQTNLTPGLPSGGSVGDFLRKTASGAAWETVQIREPRVAMTAQDTTATLDPNKLYVFPEMASLAITLATPTDSTIVNEYHFIFASGATPTTLTIPAAVKTPDGFTVDANMVYEVSILEGCMTAMSWAVSA